jgi:3-dehydroquinate dehydratase type I
MSDNRICVTLIEDDPEALGTSEPLADLFELRLDLIGKGWPGLAGKVGKPWIACNRRPEEGGKGEPDAPARQDTLRRALEAGASIIDAELQTPNLKEFVASLRGRAECLISYHDFGGTPSFAFLCDIVEAQLKAGAQICKVVTLAHDLDDNLTLLRLVRRYAERKIIAFGMGEAGQLSRVLSPLAGAYLTYASAALGSESASGQIPVRELRQIYGYLNI